MLYVKIMSGEDWPDTSPFKNFVIIPVANTAVMAFINNPNWELGSKEPRVLLRIEAEDSSIEHHEMFGNAYVMSENGKTIASHGC